jgi:Dolichyl-phosphate-mannose-protein mannosyltransferase
VTAELGWVRAPWQRYALYGALIVVTLFFALVRWHLRSLPLERDEGEYAYSGQLILEGIPAYKLAYNMKLPGTYAAYAVIMAVFGETPAGIRIGILLANAATAFLVFSLAKRLHGLMTGVVAGCTYALLSTRSSVLGFQGHATHFVALAAIAGILLLLHAIGSKRVSLFFLSGVLLGVGVLMKQHGVFLALFGGLYALWKLACEKREERGVGRIAFPAVMFSLGVVVPFAVTCLILYRDGVFREFWFWTFSYGWAYASEMSLGDGLKMIRAVGPWMLHPAIVWEIAGIGLTALLWSKRVRSQAVFTVGFLIFSLFSVIPGYYFRPHYFILLLPAAALWTGIGVAAAREWLQQHQTREWVVAMPLAIFVIAFAFSVHGQRKFFLDEDPQLALHDSHGCGDGCAEDAEVAAYLRSNSTPQDQVAVLGSEPAIYFYSHRHSATGYIYMYGLTEKQKYAQQMRHDMVAEIESARPDLIVYVDDADSWWNLGSTKEVAYLEPLEEWIESRYHLEKEIPIAGTAQHQWGDHAAYYIFGRNH